MFSSWAGRRDSVFDPAHPVRRRDTIFREARQRRSPSSRGDQGIQERHSGALLRRAKKSRRLTRRDLRVGVPSRSGANREGSIEQGTYFAGGSRKMLDRVTIERAWSGSVKLAKSSMIKFRSSSERRPLSAANAGPTLSKPDMSVVATHMK